MGKDNEIIDALVYEFVYLGFLITMAWSYTPGSRPAVVAAKKHWRNLHSILFELGAASPGKQRGAIEPLGHFKSRLGNLLSLGMQYHIVHHLYPHIPLSKTLAAYRELKPILQKRGCDLGSL